MLCVLRLRERYEIYNRCTFCSASNSLYYALNRFFLFFSSAMDRIYHSCVYANADGSRKFIAKNEKCLVSTNQCFWKDASNTCSKIKTRAMTICEKAVPLKIIGNYFKDKEKDNPVV